MKKNKRHFLLTIICLGMIYFQGFGQVGINTSTPSDNAILDVQSTDQGILIPRIALQSTNDQTTLVNAPYPESLLVYNAATNGDVTPGFYYWGGSAWIRFLTTNDVTVPDLYWKRNPAGNGVYVSHSGIPSGSENTANGLYATVAGLDNDGDGDYSSIGTGNLNTINSEGDYSFIGTGYQNSVSAAYSSILTGRQNIVSLPYSFIGSGETNTITANGMEAAEDGYHVILTGTTNEIMGESQFGFIGTGDQLLIEENNDYGTLLVGQNNTLGHTGTYNQILAGDTNSIGNNNNYSTIINGNNNTISPLVTYGLIGSGTSNSIGESCNYTSLLGGQSNTVLNFSDYSMIGTGQSNSVFGDYNTILSGFTNRILGSYSTIMTGNQCVITGDHNFIATGEENSITNESSYSWMGTGEFNHMDDSDYSVILNGRNDTINGGTYNTILGGSENYLDNTNYSTITGGAGNIARDGSYIWVNGQNNIGISDAVTVLGKNATEPNSGFTERVFVLGNGVDESNRSDALTILRDGRVGIGYNNFELNGNSQLLQVNGSAYFDTGVTISAVSYPDYVFEAFYSEEGMSTKVPENLLQEDNQYRFLPLSEVEAYVKKEGHLPGVTSRDEVLKDTQGNYLVNQTQLSIQNLEKIEELSLYVIQQQTKLAELDALMLEAKKEVKRMKKEIKSL